MSSDDPLLDRSAIEHAFGRLGDRLARRGVVADVYVFGGAAMALAYDARRATRDINSDDIRFLVKHLGLSAVDEVLALCAEVFPDEEVPARARLVLEDAFGAY